MNTLIDPKKLVDEFGIKISRLSHRMIKNNDLAKDASQEVWIEILKSLKNFKGDSTISTWIYTIAKRTILKYAVKERIYSEHEINWYCGLDPLDYSFIRVIFVPIYIYSDNYDYFAKRLWEDGTWSAISGIAGGYRRR